MSLSPFIRAVVGQYTHQKLVSGKADVRQIAVQQPQEAEPIWQLWPLFKEELKGGGNQSTKKCHIIKLPRAARKARLDNLALVPLVQRVCCRSRSSGKEQWQEVAKGPTAEKRPCSVLGRMAVLLGLKGYPVMTRRVTAEIFPSLLSAYVLLLAKSARRRAQGKLPGQPARLMLLIW